MAGTGGNKFNATLKIVSLSFSIKTSPSQIIFPSLMIFKVLLPEGI
jgi:hypothetical protein